MPTPTPKRTRHPLVLQLVQAAGYLDVSHFCRETGIGRSTVYLAVRGRRLTPALIDRMSGATSPEIAELFVRLANAAFEARDVR